MSDTCSLREDSVRSGYTVAPLIDAWRPAATRLLTKRWGEARIVSRGRVHDEIELELALDEA